MLLDYVLSQSYPCHCGTWGWDGKNLLIIIRGQIRAIHPNTRTYEIPVASSAMIPLWEEGPGTYIPFETLKFTAPRKNWELGPLTIPEGLYD